MNNTEENDLEFNESNKSICIKIAISWVLVVIWAVVIYYLSSRTAVESTVQSRNVIGLFANLLGKVIPDEETATYIDGIVRECAHGVEYFILGGLLYNALFICLNYRRQKEMLLTAETGIEVIDRFRAFKCIVCALVISSFYALSDEIHQLSVPGRSCQLLDLGIDMAGSLLGILLVFIIYHIFKHKNNGRY